MYVVTIYIMGGARQGSILGGAQSHVGGGQTGVVCLAKRGRPGMVQLWVTRQTISDRQPPPPLAPYPVADHTHQLKDGQDLTVVCRIISARQGPVFSHGGALCFCDIGFTFSAALDRPTGSLAYKSGSKFARSTLLTENWVVQGLCLKKVTFEQVGVPPA